MRGSLALAILAVACQGKDGEIFIARGDSSPDGGAVVCPAPGVNGRLAEWNADGDLRNLGVCSSWQARMAGTVPYGPARSGQAWLFRSLQMSAAGDPNYIVVPGSAGAVTPHVTVDAWVRQIGFNDYVGSNRFIVGSTFNDFAGFGPGQWALYLHQNREVYFFAKTGPDYVPGLDWSVCFFRAQTVPASTWVRYTATYDGATVRCYKNGAFESSSPLPAVADGPLGQIVIGRNYPGDVDAVRIWNRVLSPAEIVQAWP
jgi:hypothetical protein